MYLQYELTRFKLDFVQPSEKIKKLGFVPVLRRKKKRAFYENNHDLLDVTMEIYFPFEDVEQIIEKRLREDAYDTGSFRTYYVSQKTGRDTNDG